MTNCGSIGYGTAMNPGALNFYDPLSTRTSTDQGTHKYRKDMAGIGRVGFR